MKKNILFLLIDDLRADRCLSNDKKLYSTPFVEYLTKNGTSFTQAISVTSFTTPCVASMLTGMYPFYHGIEWFSGNKLNFGCVTLAEILKKAGYNTSALVTGPLGPQLGLNRGFDSYYYRSEKETLYSGFKQRFEDYLKKQNEPWFLFVHLWELHYPIYLPKHLERKSSLSFEKYDIAFSHLDQQLFSICNKIDLDNTLIVFLSDHGERLPTRSESIQRNLLGIFNKRFNSNVWFRISKKLFELFPSLREKQGHGFHIYDPLIQVPLILAGDDFPRNLVVDEQVSQVDILPTIIDALNLSPPSDYEFHGQSLLPLIRDKKELKRSIYLGPAGIFDGLAEDQRNGWLEGLRTPEWKYVTRFNRNEPVELYNLQIDSKETNNLVDARPEIVCKFKKELEMLKSSRTDTQQKMTLAEKQRIEQKLKDLGYL